MKKLKDSRAEFLQWLTVWLVAGALIEYAGGGEKAAWAWLGDFLHHFLTWVGMTLLLFFYILLAALVGSPFKPWGWFKDD